MLGLNLGEGHRGPHKEAFVLVLVVAVRDGGYGCHCRLKLFDAFIDQNSP